MSDSKKEIEKSKEELEKVLPKLSQDDLERLLYFGIGLAAGKQKVS